MENVQPNQGKAKTDLPAGFTHLYEDEVLRIYRYLAYHAGSRQEAEELTAEVFMRARGRWPQVAQVVGSPRAWLLTVANQCLVDRGQRGQRQSGSFPNSCFEPSPGQGEAGAVGNDGAATLLARLRQLPERDRVVLTLRFAAGLSSGETAAALGLDKGAAAEALLHALRRLRQLYAADAHAPPDAADHEERLPGEPAGREAAAGGEP